MTRAPRVFIRRVLSEKRMLVGWVVIGLIVDAGLYGLAVYPWTLRVESAHRRASTAATNLEAARQHSEMARRATDGKNRAEMELRTFHREILPFGLAGARSLTLARLAALADDHDLSMERRASTPDRAEDSPLARLQVSMLLSGAYRDIRRFIHAIETAPEFLVIDEIVLSRGDGSATGEVLELRLSTYYRNSDDEEHGQR